MLKNYTPHVITSYDFDGNKYTIESEGVARVTVKDHVPVWDITLGCYMTELVYGEVQGLPEPEDGTVYIVSKMCAEAMQDRNDLVYPADLERDDEGRVIACAAFARP